MKKILAINTASFFAKNTAPFNAFIWLGKDFIQLAISNESKTHIQALETYKKETGNITGNEALEVFQNRLVKEASNIYVGLESKKFTLVPETLYTEEQGTQFIKTCYPIEADELVNSQNINSLGLQSIYTLKRGTEKLLNTELKNATIQHSATALLNAYAKQIQSNDKYVSFVRLQQDEILITIFKEKKLQLHKCYDIDNLEDACYQYLDVLKQLDIPQKQMALSISGSHSNIDFYKRLMNSNLKSATFTNSISEVTFSAELQQHTLYKHLNLFALLLCA